MILENYLFSFPERAIRSAAALVGGTSLLLTETLLPDVVRSTTTYRVLIGDLQKTLISRVAQVQMAGDSPETAITDEYLQKKLVGTSLEAVGLLTVRFSPVWALAIIGDAAGGGQVFLSRLVQNLKANGIISAQSEPKSLADLLAAVQNAAHASVRAIDTPPLTSAEFTAVTDELAANYGEMGNKSQQILSRINLIGTRMEEVAVNQGLSYEQVGGIMTVDAISLTKSSLGAGLALSQTSGDLFVEQILSSYGRTLDRISQQGPAAYLSESMTPFLEAALNHLDPGKSTWTETTLIPVAKSQPLPITDPGQQPLNH
jgi:hypothetical protein